MYSYEDRLQAVKLYIKFGKRTAATIRQWGYLTKNSLKNSYEDYRRDLDLPAGYVRSKPRYLPSQKTRAVEHYLDHGRCIAATIRALGFPSRDLLAAWIHKLQLMSRDGAGAQNSLLPKSLPSDVVNSKNAHHA